MIINITSGIGEGLCEIDAFDNALIEAGIGNLNLIKLSSIIPQSTSIELGKDRLPSFNVGDKAFAVYNYGYSTNEKKLNCIGLGWSYDFHKGGVFVEKTGENCDKMTISINDSLEVLKKSRSIISSNNKKILEIKFEGKVKCAVIVAIYNIEAWKAYKS